MTVPRHDSKGMRSRICIVIVLILGLLFGARAQFDPAPSPNLPAPKEEKLPGCMMMNCVNGCCSSMPCCIRQQDKEPQPQPTPTPPPQRAGLDLGAIELLATSFQYALPFTEVKTTAAMDMAMPHTLPRRAVSCIFLI